MQSIWHLRNGWLNRLIHDVQLWFTNSLSQHWMLAKPCQSLHIDWLLITYMNPIFCVMICIILVDIVLNPSPIQTSLLITWHGLTNLSQTLVFSFCAREALQYFFLHLMGWITLLGSFIHQGQLALKAIGQYHINNSPPVHQQALLR